MGSSNFTRRGLGLSATPNIELNMVIDSDRDRADLKAWFDFQKDGVKGAIQKINLHNGCILADSVGLGKTSSALAVIKYFELRNHRVLVLCPKKLRENWTVYLGSNSLTNKPATDRT